MELSRRDGNDPQLAPVTKQPRIAVANGVAQVLKTPSSMFAGIGVTEVAGACCSRHACGTGFTGQTSCCAASGSTALGTASGYATGASRASALAFTRSHGACRSGVFSRGSSLGCTTQARRACFVITPTARLQKDLVERCAPATAKDRRCDDKTQGQKPLFDPRCQQAEP